MAIMAIMAILAIGHYGHYGHYGHSIGLLIKESLLGLLIYGP